MYCFMLLNSNKGAYERSNLSYLICLMHLIWSRVVTNRIFFPWKDLNIFLPECAACSELPANTSTTLKTFLNRHRIISVPGEIKGVSSVHGWTPLAIQGVPWDLIYLLYIRNYPRDPNTGTLSGTPRPEPQGQIRFLIQFPFWDPPLKKYESCHV